VGAEVPVAAEPSAADAATEEVPLLPPQPQSAIPSAAAAQI
jgi:hypothetical protein